MAETAEEAKKRIEQEHRARQGAPDPVNPKAQAIMAHLHDGEPVFVFRAQDILSVMVLRHYAKLVEDYTFGDASQLERVVDAANDFAHWQRNNPSLVKLPD